MNNEYKEMLERFEQICQNAKKELLCEKEEKQNDIRHFILETKDYGNFDVVEYEKYKELQDRIDKAVEVIRKYGYEKQMKEDYLINRVNLANYNCLLLDILKGDNK